MKKLLVGLLLSGAFSGPLFAYTFTVHNNTDTPMEVRLVEALSSDVRKTVAPFITEKIETQHGGTCTREVIVTGMTANDGKDATEAQLALKLNTNIVVSLVHVVVKKSLLIIPHRPNHLVG